MICQASIKQQTFLTNDIVQLFVTPAKPRFSWLAGQWIDFACVIDGTEHVAGYSICSAAGSGDFELLVRKSQHPVSTWLHSANRTGTTIRIQGGSGRCVYLPEQHESIVCLAGGIGITPMISMLRTARQHQRQAILYHTVKTREELLFAEEFPDAHYFVSRENQKLCFETALHNHGSEAHYFLCGPRSFIDQGTQILQQQGAQNIHFERWW